MSALVEQSRGNLSSGQTSVESRRSAAVAGFGTESVFDMMLLSNLAH
jgi:hypothetical protein